MIRIGKIRIGRIDWDSADFTYGQRIELGEIFSDKEKSEYYRLCAAFRCMYGWSRRLVPMPVRIRMFSGIIDGLKAWIDKEQRMLAYAPSSDEVAAGIRELTAKVGNMSTIKSLAKAYNTDPDEVLRWPYGKVFVILYTDLEERKYEKKLMNNAYGKHNKRGQH